MEDSLLFSYYYGHFRPVLSIFTSHVGQNYLTVPPYFFAWLFSRFDVRLQPWLYQWWGYAWAVMAASALSFSGLFRSRVILLLAPTVLGLLGLNDIFYWNTLIYTMYTGLLVLFSFLFYPAPKTRFGMMVMGILFVLLPWSGPYCVLLLPVGLLHLLLFRDRKKRILVILGMCSSLGYFFTVQSNTTRLEHLKPWILGRYFHVLMEQVFFFQLPGQLPLYWLAAIALLIAACFYVCRDSTDLWKNILVMLTLIFASLSLFFLSVKFPLYGHTLACHRLISSFFWLALLLYLADNLLRKFKQPLMGSLAIALVFAGLVLWVNLRYPSLGQAEKVPALGSFLRAIHWLEGQGLEEKNSYVVLRLPGKYPVMQPVVRIGSRRTDARYPTAVILPDAAWRVFLVHEQ